MKGVVTAVLRSKGFGFLTDEEGRDRFWHARSLLDVDLSAIQEGTKVEFEPYEHCGRGAHNNLRARNLRVLA